MATDIVLLHYNNYFNRQIKVAGNVLSDYTSEDIYYSSVSVVNFNEADGIDTSLILGKGELPTPSKALDSYDYLLVVDHEQTEGEYPVLSRWFIIDRDRTRDGQYVFNLRRDVIADKYQEVMSAPCYVEKGIVPTTNDPLIYNPENMSFNQIKKGETPIIDETGCSWLVGYLKKGLTAKTKSGTMSQDLANAYSYSSLFFKDAITSDDGLISSSITLINPSSLNIKFTSRGVYSGSGGAWQFKKFNGDITDNTNHQYSYLGFETPNTQTQISWEGLNSYLFNDTFSSYPDSTGSIRANTMNTNVGSIPTVTKTSFRTYINNSVKTNNNIKEVSELSTLDDYASLLATYNGALVIKDGVYYKLNIYLGNSTSASSYFDYQSNSIIGTYMDYFVASNFTKNETGTAMSKLKGILGYNQIVILAQKQDTTEGSITITIPDSSSRYTTEDALYDIFAVPYIPNQYSSEMTSTFIDANGTQRTVNSPAMLFITQQLMTTLNMGQSSAEAYDLQILPYCPILMPNNNDLRNLNVKSYSVITQSQTIEGQATDVPIGYVVFASNCNFSKNIDFRKALIDNTPLGVKISNECDFLRLTSPNWNSMYEFKLSKFNDGIHLFNIDCSYKPMTPYIKINPDYSGLYGEDWNDSTGLILSGDFSLPVMNDAWINYQMNNKNYQAIFNRQIQNLDVNNQIALEQQQFSATIGAITGTIGGGAGGATAGGKAGPVGAIAGAVAGTIGGATMNAIGIAKDRDWLYRSQAEARSYATDQYSYQLGNIKALPQSISKSDPLTYNNKIWPILEEFSCTDKEKTLLREKIRQNGMNIMAIGTLADYSNTTDFDKAYVKGQIIRLENLQDDSHFANAIYEEVNKGLYITQ